MKFKLFNKKHINDGYEEKYKYSKEEAEEKINFIKYILDVIEKRKNEIANIEEKIEVLKDERIKINTKKLEAMETNTPENKKIIDDFNYTLSCIYKKIEDLSNEQKRLLKNDLAEVNEFDNIYNLESIFKKELTKLNNSFSINLGVNGKGETTFSKLKTQNNVESESVKILRLKIKKYEELLKNPKLDDFRRDEINKKLATLKSYLSTELNYRNIKRDELDNLYEIKKEGETGYTQILTRPGNFNDDERFGSVFLKDVSLNRDTYLFNVNWEYNFEARNKKEEDNLINDLLHEYLFKAKVFLGSAIHEKIDRDNLEIEEKIVSFNREYYDIIDGEKKLRGTKGTAVLTLETPFATENALDELRKVKSITNGLNIRGKAQISTKFASELIPFYSMRKDLPDDEWRLNNNVGYNADRFDKDYIGDLIRKGQDKDEYGITYIKNRHDRIINPKLKGSVPGSNWTREDHFDYKFTPKENISIEKPESFETTGTKNKKRKIYKKSDLFNSSKLAEPDYPFSLDRKNKHPNSKEIFQLDENEYEFTPDKVDNEKLSDFNKYFDKDLKEFESKAEKERNRVLTFKERKMGKDIQLRKRYNPFAYRAKYEEPKPDFDRDVFPGIYFDFYTNDEEKYQNKLKKHAPSDWDDIQTARAEKNREGSKFVNSYKGKLESVKNTRREKYRQIGKRNMKTKRYFTDSFSSITIDDMARTKNPDGSVHNPSESGVQKLIRSAYVKFSKDNNTKIVGPVSSVKYSFGLKRGSHISMADRPGWARLQCVFGYTFYKKITSLERFILILNKDYLPLDKIFIASNIDNEAINFLVKKVTEENKNTYEYNNFNEILTDNVVNRINSLISEYSDNIISKCKKEVIDKFEKEVRLHFEYFETYDMTMKYIKKSALNNGFTDPIIDIDFSDCSQMKIDYNGLRGTNNAYNSGTEFIAMNESNNPEKFLMYNKKNYKKNYESYSLTFRIENINVYIRVKEFNIDYKNKMNQMDKKFDETRENKPKDIEEDLLNSYFDDSDILSQKEIDSLEEEIERMKLEGMELKLSTLIKRARIPYEKENVAKIWVKKNHDYFTDLILDSKSVTDSSSRRSERLDAAGQDLLEYLDDEFNPSHDSLESLKEQLKIYLSDYRSNFDPNLVFYVTEHFEEIFNEVFGKEFEVIEESNSDDIY